MTDGWRVEADDDWLATHSSDNFARLRRRLRRVGFLGDAISQAELGPFGGAPRKPQLSIGHKAYAVVRYVHHRFAYTVIKVELERCRRCGRQLLEVHRMLTVREDGRSRPVGVVRVCRSCGADSWMFFSRMPRTVRARRRGRKVVL